MKFLFHFLFLFICISVFAEKNKAIFEGPPVFHGASVVGNYPNTPFLFTVPVTGERPIAFTTSGLPEGLKIDAATGIITGTLVKAGEYTVRVDASNGKGKNHEEIKIVIGDKLALTPPMGWNSWNVFAWDINEEIVMHAADAMASNGMRDVGYEYINIDDFWHADEREPDGRPKADAKKFPHGMKWLCDYVHSKGLKFGIYSCAGNKTCGKKFGGYQHEEIDAKTYAEWGVDLLKYDYCFANPLPTAAKKRYTTMGTALKRSGRSIVFSICEWGGRWPWKWGAKVGGQYWRTTGDIYDHWTKSVLKIVDKQRGHEKYSGPGHWNDPDMLLVGNYGKGRATGGKDRGCTDREYQSHMSLWCLLDAPLLASNDLSNMSDTTYNILTNPEILDINQDPLGKQAKRIIRKGTTEVFYKPLADGSVAVGVFNRADTAINYTLAYNQLPGSTVVSYIAHDVWQHTDLGKAGDNIALNINPHEVRVLRLRKP